MNLDTRSFHTFSRLAHLGAEKIAGSLATLVDIDMYVNVTKARLGTKSDVGNELAERDLMSACIGFSGGLDGHAVLVFSPESVEQLVDALISGISTTDTDGELAESNLKEIANIMLDGFIDGWADYPDATIDITTPTHVDNENDSPLDHVDAKGFENGGDDEHVLAFRNQLETADNVIEFDLYVVPTVSSIGAAVETSGDDGAFPVESSVASSEMVNDGATRASEDITTMMDIDMITKMSRLSFVPIESVPMSLTDAIRRGVILEFSGTPSGYIAILLDEPLAENVANSLLPGMEDDEAMRQSTIQEIGNITTSGFPDDWANALEMTTDISSPKHVHDIGSTIIDPLATDPAQSQGYAFLIDSTIRTNSGELTYDICTLPDETGLHKALKQFSPATWPLHGEILMRVYAADTPTACSSRIGAGIADFVVSSGEDTLTASGLGSCIGVALYGPETGVSEFTHAMLPEADDGSEPVKFVNTGVKLLIVEIQAIGTDTDRIVARVAGGSTMFGFTSTNGGSSIGDRNVVATRTTLDGSGINIIAEDVGSSHSRSLELDSETGDLRI